MSKRILITGGAGYIGNVLVPLLLNEGYTVTVLDNLYFKQQVFLNLCHLKNFKFIKGSVLDRKLLLNTLKNQEFIIPLAGLVGAPLCSREPELAYQLNFQIIKELCTMINSDQKIIMPVSNSGYGAGEKEKIYSEESPLNPISVYGKTKVDSEKEVLRRENSITLRLATVFGMSPRMRFDLLVNNFVYNAYFERKLNIFEGHFVRNYIHIIDVCRVFNFMIKNFDRYKSNVFNVGLEDANISKLDLALKIKEYLPNLEIIEDFSQEDPDKRNYIVSNKKLISTGFKTIFSLDRGITELINGLDLINLEMKNKNI